MEYQINRTNGDIQNTYEQGNNNEELFFRLEEKNEILGYNTSTFAVLFLCWLVAVLSTLDRVAMSVAIIPLAGELHLDDSTKGLISSAFSLGYAVTILPVGLILSVSSPRLVIGTGVALWSLMTALTPLASEFGIGALVAARVMIGSAEAVVIPSIQKLLSSWVPSAEKSASSIAGVFSGFQCGTVLAYLLSPILVDTVGWKGMFMVYGTSGLFWLFVWLKYARDEPDGNAVVLGSSLEDNSNGVEQMNSGIVSLLRFYDRKDDTDALNCDNNGSIFQSKFDEALSTIRDVPIRQMISSPSVIATATAHAAANWGLYNSLAWTPTFYAQQYGLDVHDSAVLSILPSLAGAAAGLSAGTIADALVSRGGFDLTSTRRFIQSVALLGPAACLFALASHIPDVPASAQALLVGATSLQATGAAGYGSAVQDKAGGKWAGFLYALTSVPGVLAGSGAVWLTGRILDSTGQDWSVVYGLNVVVDVIGALAFLTLYNSEKEFE
eukprot:CAMPEP_0113310086 /NCGR_PEP_ID=MMETSP0010_2-20120614/7869_1 /TAXON_ID=216773 ORGANISM="Corethron hystrix, Strain 308" /NCGR_SAMPLE_ID=MMETSP0010_2 /ASSEMBLY_ACC=CAM_ASM_000155 /LENGTH=496 /DNA_ID=CAMNT_0000165465 /DNA_START=495 /DNA_END=1986 /DNA_ORIENTATION=+ /assembly_acc=CAM_ASM_000155